MANETNALAVVNRGVTARQEFTGVQVQNTAETGVTAAAAREQAIVTAQYMMAERHPRVWPDVRVAMLDHCRRPRFAEISRYKKPVGGRMDGGVWIEQFARGFTIRFAETLAQEMGNVKPEAAVTSEDDLMRIVRISVTDLQRNVPWSREVAFAKTVEKRGKKEKSERGKPDSWKPPEGREVLGMRVNSYGEPTYLCKATEDEMRNKVNSEISKTQRDFLIKLCPRDLLEDWEDAVYLTLSAEDKRDPAAALKRWLDSFHRIGVEPSDLETYFGKKTSAFGPVEVAGMRELSQALKDGESTFAEALKAKYDRPQGTTQEREKLLEEKLRAADEPANEAPAGADTGAPAPPVSTYPVRHYLSWDAWQEAGAPEGLPEIHIAEGPNAGVFVWQEKDGGAGSYKAVVPAQQPTSRRTPPPVFGKKG